MDLCENSGVPITTRAMAVAKAQLLTLPSFVLRHGSSKRHIMMLVVTIDHHRAQSGCNVHRRHDASIRTQLYRPGNYRAFPAQTLRVSDSGRIRIQGMDLLPVGTHPVALVRTQAHERNARDGARLVRPLIRNVPYTHQCEQGTSLSSKMSGTHADSSVSWTLCPVQCLKTLSWWSCQMCASCLRRRCASCATHGARLVGRISSSEG